MKPNRKPRGAARLTDGRVHSTKPHDDSPRVNQNKSGAEEQDNTGNNNVRIWVADEIRVQALPDLVSEYKAANEADSSHNKKTILIGWLTFGAVFAYSALALWQVLETRRSIRIAREANLLTIDSVRARIIVVDPKFSGPLTAGSHMGMQSLIRNVGRSQGFYSVEFSSSRWAGMPEGDMPITYREPDTPADVDERYSFFIYEPERLTQQYLDNIPTVQQIANTPPKGDLIPDNARDTNEIYPQQLTTYFYGRVAYDSIGPRRVQEFCFYVAKTDLSLPQAPTDNGDRRFMLISCPKWNGRDK